ncbi:MAG: tetratricopeptide repeat protein, partial [Thermodesulfovibrionales bacterium]
MPLKSINLIKTMPYRKLKKINLKIKIFHSRYPVIVFLLYSFIIFLLSNCGGGASKKEADFYYKLGASYIREGEFQKAFVELQKAKELDPANKETFNLLGLLYSQFEDHDNAIKHFKKAIAIDKNFSDARNNLGTVYASQKRWD